MPIPDKKVNHAAQSHKEHQEECYLRTEIRCIPANTLINLAP
jgi:hypothetical protein